MTRRRPKPLRPAAVFALWVGLLLLAAATNWAAPVVAFVVAYACWANFRRRVNATVVHFGQRVLESPRAARTVYLVTGIDRRPERPALPATARPAEIVKIRPTAERVAAAPVHVPQAVDMATARTAAKLRAMFAERGVDATVVGFTQGPSVTQFAVEKGVGTTVDAILKLSKEIAYAVGTADVRMVSPIPGRSAIGIELPNEARRTVRLADVLASPEARGNDAPLLVGLGEDMEGRHVVADLAKGPHTLVGGVTGSGKSVFLNVALVSILRRTTPDQVRLLLVDPKRVELAAYKDIPHLVVPIVNDPSRAVDAFAWTVREMESRYDRFAEVGARNLDEYNKWARKNGETPMPSLLVVVDELATLMMVAKQRRDAAKRAATDELPDDPEQVTARLGAEGRAAGIHLLLATQRPDATVVTGLIKANVPARLAFAVSDAVNSRIILDQNGAEALYGAGDALFLPQGASTPIRLQGSWVDEQEIAEAVRHAKAWGPPQFRDDVLTPAPAPRATPQVTVSAADLQQARALVVEKRSASVSMLQRQMQIGFPKAARLLDALEAAGAVGPARGSKPREVLVKE
jgi:S-DNA-T family DNA segregation ATPase FtsK/SpoIIIE